MTAPLDARVGIGFEIMVQCHLVRLCEASNRCSNDSGQDHATHWAGQYNLRQAWPPSSSRSDNHFSDYTATMDEINRNYADYDDEDIDIGTNTKLLEGKNDFDLVLRQTASNAQGADLMILILGPNAKIQSRIHEMNRSRPAQSI
jgi:hypothetical protein